MLPFKKIEFLGVKGINKLSLTFDEAKMNVFIGNNGVGKTKALECLFQELLFSSHKYNHDEIIFEKQLSFEESLVDSKPHIENKAAIWVNQIKKIHELPVVFISALNRGKISSGNLDSVKPLGEFEERKTEYFSKVFSSLTGNSDNISIEEWFVQRILSGNILASEEDNRFIEITSVLNILHQIDERIDNSPLTSETKPIILHGGKSVSLNIGGERRRLNELSSGFASLLKIVQTIISGYSYFTNSTKIEEVEGIVLIDEIESHLHISWQSKILPLLSKVFPNTTFIIATHSSLVLSQMVVGKAYRLVRENDCVTNKEIKNPADSSLIDLLFEAFNTDVNALKINDAQPSDQTAKKSQILELLRSKG
ncbi:putative ATP-binding protein involved in virulence [Cricetibacter osteomyelitidis]|uniref:Putative ATP-binding protein involved in virulence n=1 Tax=Cricetibacter osteomyelitidis TaxID=1521931 RepID=A0A4R2TFJ1_9PAST|nr:AAA family ATPase [Cricetibacter osteomyelitidis]TCP95968.1 putative ATP-binding protein involved in virulence [Cricetibacter osteomyelitidis]